MTFPSTRSGRGTALGWACIVAMLLAAGAAAQPTLRIGTWNLEQLGLRQPPRTAADEQAIADRIRELAVGVLAVQEVDGPAPLRRLTHDLGPTWDFVIGSTGQLSNDDRISVGFVYDRSRVELLQSEELLQLPRTAGRLPIFHRVPVTAVFRTVDGGLDFRAVTVHLKASRGADNEAKRVAEVTALAGWIDHLRERDGEDRDLVVLGDFNHTYGAPADQAFTSHCPITYLHPQQPAPTIIHFDDPIDMIAVTPELKDEVIANSMTVHGADAQRDKQAWRKTYSDHVPVTVDLDDAHDRDPEATFEDVDPAHRLLPGGWAMAELLRGPPRSVDGTVDGARDAFAVGTRVRVTVGNATQAGSPYPQGPSSYSGRLLVPLEGPWVELRLDDGEAVALPATAIVTVRPDSSGVHDASSEAPPSGGGAGGSSRR